MAVCFEQVKCRMIWCDALIYLVLIAFCTTILHWIISKIIALNDICLRYEQPLIMSKHPMFFQATHILKTPWLWGLIAFHLSYLQRAWFILTQKCSPLICQYVHLNIVFVGFFRIPQYCFDFEHPGQMWTPSVILGCKHRGDGGWRDWANRPRFQEQLEDLCQHLHIIHWSWGVRFTICFQGGKHLPYTVTVCYVWWSPRHKIIQLRSLLAKHPNHILKLYYHCCHYTNMYS